MSAPTAQRLGPPSPLVLGTAQFGGDYGVANRTGRPSFAAVLEIIRTAHEGGVDTLDTAPAYGGSEEWIGRALGELGLRDRMRVATKVGPLPTDLPGPEAARLIEASVAGSLRRLGLERVSLCLFHREADIRYAAELAALRARGWIGAAGVSLVSPEGAREALGSPALTAWQIPSNLLDRRFTHSGLTKAAKDAGVTVLVRSAYLQGLLLMDDDATPPFLRAVIPARRRLAEIARRHGMPLGEMALRAMLGRADVRSVVVGVETAAQIRDNIAVFARGGLPPSILAELEALEPDLPAFVANPPDWDRAREAHDALRPR
jgi:aryl-alcohol dehydrogenase-like predicted oxidoreductase